MNRPMEKKEYIPINENECKSRLLELLCSFDQICKQNNLTYFLMWGTLIGAARHQGFIPWDDDIDVGMPREDYLRFAEICKNENESYRFLCDSNVPDYPLFFGKFTDKKTVIRSKFSNNFPGVGLFIDVFPIDYCNVQEKHISKMSKKLLNYERMLNLSNMKQFWPARSKVKSAVKYILFRYAAFRGVTYWKHKHQKLLENICSASENGTCTFCVCGSWILRSEWFSTAVSLTFENKRFMCPVGFDSVLAYRYGDYMKIPSVEKQVSVHDFDVFREKEKVK